MENTENIVAAIREIKETAVAAAEPTVIEVDVSDGKAQRKAKVLVLGKSDGDVEVIGLSDLLQEASDFARADRLLDAPGPDRREGLAVHQALLSFMEHAARFKSPDSAVWANAQARRLVAVLDYHPEGAASPARWGKHRGVYECPLSDAWKAWGGETGLELSQEGFAQLLDDRDRELADGKLPTGNAAPPPASLVTLAANLETYSTASVKRMRDPNTQKVKLVFSEEKGVAGDLLPPPAFLIRIPIFQDRDPQDLEVRLRVTVDGGKATFNVQIHAAAEVLRQAFIDLCATVHSETAIPIFVGTPEQS